MKKFFSHLSIFIFFFILTNIIASILWQPIKNSKFSNINKKDYYSKEVLEVIGLDIDEQFQFYNEMWTERKFKYVQFAEHLEAETKNQKYVNVSQEYGRKVENNNDCDSRIFFYGASQVFGYNVKDNQTIPSYFKKIVDNKLTDKSYCIYNFGSASYYSTQENILFINHFLKQKILPNDYAIFIDGYTEFGNDKSRIHNQIKYIFEGLDLKVWDELKFSSLIFINSLPAVKLYKNLQKKFSNKSDKIEINNNILDNEKMNEINKVFKSNLIIRNAICKNISITCYTFLPPIHEDSDLVIKKKYELFRNIDFLIDISEILDENKYLNYVDDGHYTPKASNFIAEEIFDYIDFK